MVLKLNFIEFTIKLSFTKKISFFNIAPVTVIPMPKGGFLKKSTADVFSQRAVLIFFKKPPFGIGTTASQGRLKKEKGEKTNFVSTQLNFDLTGDISCKCIFSLNEDG